MRPESLRAALLFVAICTLPVRAEEGQEETQASGTSGKAARPESMAAVSRSRCRGIGQGTNLPDRWSAKQNVAWKRAIPGRGWSSPVVWQNRVFLTTVINRGDSEVRTKGCTWAATE